MEFSAIEQLKNRLIEAKNNSPFVSYWIGTFGLILIVILAYWYYEARHPSTDDSYLQANVVDIGAQVSGRIDQVFVNNYQFVTKGSLIAAIDARPFQIAVAKAKAQLIEANRQVKMEQMAVDEAKANLADAKAGLDVARSNMARILKLVKKGEASLAEGTKAEGDIKSTQAKYDSAQQQYFQAQEKLGASIANNPEILEAQAELANAELNLSYTRLYAPVSGSLMNFNLRPGAIVSAQQILFSLIDNSSWWVEANFKETDLKRIKPGQSAEVNVDIYPGKTFKGIVESISGGSGSAFSLLPAENASGNWVKVTQRFTVRIRLVNPPANLPLRVGASCSVTVATD